MKLNELRDTSFEIAKSLGWHDPDFDKATFDDRMALVISELSEALEEHRKGKPPAQIEYVRAGEIVALYQGGTPLMATDATPSFLIGSGCKPEGIIIELGDAVIRIGDAAGKHALDLGTVTVASLFVQDESDPKSFGGWFCRASHELAEAARTNVLRSACMLEALCTICGWAYWLGISGEEFERAIEIKHAYNRTRPFRHGGKLL